MRHAKSCLPAFRIGYHVLLGTELLAGLMAVTAFTSGHNLDLQMGGIAFFVARFLRGLIGFLLLPSASPILSEEVQAPGVAVDQTIV